MMDDRKDATEFTKRANSAVLNELPFEDLSDFDDAKRGFIAPLPNEGIIMSDDGQKIVWDVKRFSEFIKEGSAAPDTINPSLWRQSQLVNMHGLFKVTDRLFQVRNADISNMTVIEGDTGIIVVDPLISAECAKAALNLYYEHRPKKPVLAVFYSHSHVDHFGGVKGVVSGEDVKSGKVMVVAPEGFVKAVISENVLAGNAMARRAVYMMGNTISADSKGHVGAGLGMTSSNGTVTLILPTHLIKKNRQKMHIDGLDFDFILTPDSEAPAEMHWYIEQLRALTPAENCSHTMHNVYTPRGARVRDPLLWSKYLDNTIAAWAHKSDLMYRMHHWPVWGKEKLVDLLKKSRDGYRFINDQTLRLANQGYTMEEIAEHLRLPPELDRHFAFRGYYGTLPMNIKAAYVKYLGHFDGNPANLYPLPHVETSKKYIECMGGAEAVIDRANAAFQKGEYRWVVELVNRVVFADPAKKKARELQADALEQLGYQAESGIWRNFYLTGAKELRHNISQKTVPLAGRTGLLNAMDLHCFFDLLGVRLNGEKAAGKKIVINMVFPDVQEKYVLNLENSALTHQANVRSDNADATVTLTTSTIKNLLIKQTNIQDEITAGNISIDGDASVFAELMSFMDSFQFWFNIIEPRNTLHSTEQ